MAEPGAEPVSRVVAHRAHLGRRPERVGYPFGGALVVGSEADSHMAVVENGVVGAISLFDLVQRLCDQEALQSVAGHEGQRGLEEVEPPRSEERRVGKEWDSTVRTRVSPYQ